MLVLKTANLEDSAKEYAFVKDMPADENGMKNPWAGCSEEEFKNKALPEMIAYSEGKDLPDDFVPETFFFLWKDDEVIGHYRVRHYLNNQLRSGAGHIGYCIKKEYRDQGYGTEGMKMLLEKAEELIREKEFHLRVRKDNPASLRVIMKNGGRIISEDNKYYFIRIPIAGRR
ncbi:MAG: GNAT family N-acetyltransferase [Solobacterium sp.]|nr:GNAT family N-acetyltransferase [Solobacterium sp.]